MAHTGRGRRSGGFVILTVTVAALLAGMPAVASAAAAASFEATVAPEGTSTPAPTARRIEDDDLRVAFSGRWWHVWDPAASGYSRRVTGSAGAGVSLRFRGSGIALIAPLGPDGGLASISIDGVGLATVSLYASVPATSVVVWSIDGLPSTEHVVRVKALGKGEPASGGVRVSIDAFDVLGVVRPYGPRPTVTVQQSDVRIHRTGRWRTRRSAGASGGSAMTTTARGSSATIRFVGTAVAWVGRTSRTTGLAEVVLDGRRVAVVGGSPAASKEKRVRWAASGLARRTHTLTIRALDRPTPSLDSSGTAVDVDCFLVSGSPRFAPRPTPFPYRWRTYIVVDKSEFRLYWVRDRRLLNVYPVAHGKVGWATPSRIWRIDAKYLTDPSGVYGPRKMRLFKLVGSRFVFTRYAIHGTNEPWVIGTRASHGCIRMYNRDVRELFDQVPLGTMVVTRD